MADLDNCPCCYYHNLISQNGKLKNENAALRLQRDKLLAAAKEASEWMYECCVAGPVADELKAAIDFCAPKPDNDSADGNLPYNSGGD